MFKKINQFLITRYPLLWNTRIVFVLPVVLCIHVLFYLAGLVDPIGLEGLADYGHFNTDDETLLSVLVTSILVILWLAFYLRNNPFKSYYSLSSKYLFAEFLVIFIVFLTSATFFLSYKQGLYDNVYRKTKDIDLASEANLVNLSRHFISFYQDDFERNNCCDSINARAKRDSAIHAQQLHKQVHEGSEPETYVETTTDDEEGTDTVKLEYSYLYYCQRSVVFYDSAITLLDNEQINDIAVKWLNENKKDSVKELLNHLLVLCEKYGASYFFYPEKQVEECFNDEQHSVKNDLYSYRPDNTVERNYYIEIQDVESSLERIHQVRKGFWDLDILLFILYYSLGVSILLFTFRLTRLKHWFTSLIGTGILSIIVSLCVVWFETGDNTPWLLLALWLVFLFYSHINIAGKGKKLFSGVSFNWFTWSVPFVIPIICTMIMSELYQPCYEGICPPAHPVYAWIKENWRTIGFSNIAVFVLLLAVYIIPLARKWQANPEE